MVYQRNEDFDTSCGHYGSIKVGLQIDERIFWFAIDYFGIAALSGKAGKQQEVEYKRWEGIVKQIVKALEGVNGIERD